MPATAPPPLWNLRDVGGYETPTGTVRRGLVFRSNAPVKLDADARAALGEFGFATAIDIREPGEAAGSPCTVEGCGFDIDLIPFAGVSIASGQSMNEYLVETLDTRGREIADLVRMLGDPARHPVVFFCVSGKDRTGTLTAILLSALGVSDEDVADDFELTQKLMPQWHEDRTLELALELGIDAKTVREGLRASRETMLHVLAHLREKHGGASEYLGRHGLDDADLERIRATLIEAA